MSFYCCASPVQPFLEVSNPAHQHIAADGDDGNQNNSKAQNKGNRHDCIKFPEKACSINSQNGKEQDTHGTAHQYRNAQESMHKLGEQSNCGSYIDQTFQHGENIKKILLRASKQRVGIWFM